MPKDPMSKSKKVSKSAKAGLNFPVNRVSKLMRKGKLANRFDSKASVFMTAVLEYLSTEILDLAGDSCKDLNQLRINPKHISLAVRNDDDLRQILANVTISEGHYTNPLTTTSNLLDICESSTVYNLE